MNNLMDVMGELYQYLFIGSVIYIWYLLILFGLKVYGRFILKMDETKFVLTKIERNLLWIAVTTFFTYIIK